MDKHFGKILFLLQAEAIQAGSDCTVDYKKNILKWLMAFKYVSGLVQADEGVRLLNTKSLQNHVHHL